MRTDYHPGRLAVARSLLGLTQTELAAHTGVAQSLVSQIENTQRALTEDVAVRFAAGLDLPIEFFRIDGGPTLPGSLMFRKLAGARVRLTNTLAAQYGEARRVATQLLEEGRSATTDLPTATGLLAPSHIEALAQEVRQHLGYSMDEPVRHLTRSAERIGVAFVSLAVPGDGSWTGHDGMSGDWTDTGRAVIATISTEAGDRARFSKAHELGHIVLHPRRPTVDEKVRETEAHRFAGALLFPQTLAERHLSETLSVNGYVRLKAQYGISIQALVRRGYDLALISQSRYRSLQVQISSKGWKKQEPVTVGLERPALLWSLMRRLHGEEPYEAAAPVLGMAERFLRAWVPERVQPATPPRGGRRIATVTHIRRAS